MTFSYHKDIDHWVIYHLKDVCEMNRRSLNHISWIIAIPYGVAVSRPSGNSSSNLTSVTSNPALVYASLIVSLRKDWESFKTWYCEYFLFINFNIITRNYCLNKTTLILVVAFLLSVSRYIMTLVSLSLTILIGVNFHLCGIFWKQKPWRCVVFSEEISFS